MPHTPLWLREESYRRKVRGKEPTERGKHETRGKAEKGSVETHQWTQVGESELAMIACGERPMERKRTASILRTLSTEKWVRNEHGLFRGKLEERKGSGGGEREKSQFGEDYISRLLPSWISRFRDCWSYWRAVYCPFRFSLHIIPSPVQDMSTLENTFQQNFIELERQTVISSICHLPITHSQK